MDNQISFSQFGRSFQEKILQAFLSDSAWAAQMVEVMNPEFFDIEYLKFLCDRYFKYYNKYKSFPTLGLLVTIIKEDLSESSDQILRDQIVDYLIRTKANPHPGDISYVKEKSLDFCKKQAFKEALEKAVDLIQGENFEQVLDLMKKAVSVGLPNTSGHDFFGDIEARFIKVNRNACPTGFKRLDDKDIFQGGLGRGELGVVVANTGVGKCCIGDTHVRVRHMEITINGKLYKPWDKIQTKRGVLFAKDVMVDGDSILDVQFSESIRDVTLAELFSEFSIEIQPENELQNKWDIDVLSFDDFYRIEGFRTTEPLSTVLLKFDNGVELEAAEKHRVMSMTRGDWTYVSDLEIGETVVSHNNSPKLVEKIAKPAKQILYDMQVETCHSFMTNGLLSHNSHWLVAIGANAMRIGKNVLHYTFELTEHAVGLRYDSNLCGVPSNEVQDMKDLVSETYKNKSLGRLIIKEYPTGSASVMTVRNHIEKLQLKGFKPDVLVIDYADIMKSSKSYDSLRHELKLVYEELRNLAMELEVPIWTASQANRDSAQSDVVGLENMSEAYGKAMVADVVVSLSRKASEKATGFGRLFIAKNRAGRDGIMFPISIDTAMSQFEILDENSLSLNEVASQKKSDLSDLLKKKWKEVNQKEENV